MERTQIEGKGMHVLCAWREHEYKESSARVRSSSKGTGETKGWVGDRGQDDAESHELLQRF